MLDDATQDILTHYPTCERFIDQGRDKGNVLIHWYELYLYYVDNDSVILSSYYEH